MTVSIIVAVKDNNPNLKECVEHCLALDYPDFEIIILPDREIALPYPKTRVIPTGEVTPPRKRDMAIALARGEIVAFLDDDTYPVKSWLSAAIKHFAIPEIAAVVGPAVTPDSDTLRQKASGLVYSSWLMSGGYACRYLPKKQQYVDDFPSCNFLIRKTALRHIGGFNTTFWPGEDTFLCLKIVRDLKKKIIYDPEVLVYHHRRSLFRGHLKQITQYALHRGYFVKRFPETSLKFSYFLPSLLAAGIALGGIASLQSEALRVVYCLTLGVYLLTVFFSSLSRDVMRLSIGETTTLSLRATPSVARGSEAISVRIVSSPSALRNDRLNIPSFTDRLLRDIRLTGLVFSGIIISHIMYGVYFIKGLLAKRMPEENEPRPS